MPALTAVARPVPVSPVATRDELARRALTVARRTALGVLGDREAAADVAQEVALNARVSPAQRAAMLDVLAADPSAKDLGEVQDDLGRTGRGVALHCPGRQFLSAANRFELIFRPDSSELLE